MNEVDNAVVADCIEYGINAGIVISCLGVLGFLAMRQSWPKVTRRGPLTLGEALARRRKGISLIEVLMSIFILSIGVLGVAALFPLAHHLANSGAVSDRTSTFGRAAARDFKVRGHHCVSMWMNPPASLVSLDNTNPLSPLSPVGPKKYLLDPRGVSRGLGAFPSGGTLSIPRFTLYHSQPPAPALSPTAADAMTQAHADEVFSCHDDLVFTVDDNDPLAQPLQVGDPPGTSQRRFAARDFTWMTMLTREGDGDYYDAAIIVMQGRHTPIAADELELPATVSGGIGGAEVELTGTATTGPRIEALRDGQWIMFAHAERVAWYRILSSTDYDAATYKRLFTVAGRDWDTSGGYASPKAVLLPGVVGVYSLQIRLTRDNPF